MRKRGSQKRANRLGGFTVDEKLAFLSQVARKGKHSLLSALPTALGDRSASVRSMATMLAMEHGLREVSRQVEFLLADRSIMVRVDAATFIGELERNTNKAHMALRALLGDPVALVRAQALDSLALIGDQGAIPRIARLLSDPDAVVRSYAASSIGDLQGFDYRRHLVRALKVETQDRARVGMLEALFLLGNRGTLKELLSLLTSVDYHVRCSVANVVAALELRPAETATVVIALKGAYRNPLAVADKSTVKKALARVSQRRKLLETEGIAGPERLKAD